MTAAGPLRRPAENGRDALVDAQADAGIRSGGDPEHARTDEQVRHGLDDVVLLFAYLATGHLARECPERPDDGRRIDGILMLPGTEPAEGIVKVGEQELRIVLAVVLMQKKTRQFRDFLFFRIVCQRGMLHRAPPCLHSPMRPRAPFLARHAGALLRKTMAVRQPHRKRLPPGTRSRPDQTSKLIMR